jgi:acetate kinase
MAHALEHESGMLALAGSADMRTVIEGAAAGEDDAALALDVYVHRLRGGIGAMAAAMDGLDVIVWTGGVGEHAPAIRALASAGLGFLGVSIDSDRNRAATDDADLTAHGAAVSSVVIRAREDLEIARQVRRVLRIVIPEPSAGVTQHEESQHDDSDLLRRVRGRPGGD